MSEIKEPVIEKNPEAAIGLQQPEIEAALTQIERRIPQSISSAEELTNAAQQLALKLPQWWPTAAVSAGYLAEATALFKWASKATEPNQRSRRAAIAVVSMVLSLASGGGVAVLLGSKEEIGEKLEDEKWRANLPEEVRARLEKRKDFYSKTTGAFEAYRTDPEYNGLDPFNIDHPAVMRATAEIGPSWMFEVAAKDKLNKALETGFTEKEIKEYQLIPQYDQRIVARIEELAKEGKVDQRVVDFYRQSLTESGRQQVFEEYRNKFVAPQRR